ncbi:MAG: hypothetical protein D4R58_00640 [Betaproteobacteria bacterium]|nr:MAG: hypothetical protein D4R58_00640 [Betaproteobacteria bacterium]
MNIETRVDKIERHLANGEIDLVFVITNEGCPPQSVRINGERFSRQEDETLQDLADRALQQYRMQHKPTNNVSVLIVDCRTSIGVHVKERLRSAGCG